MSNWIKARVHFPEQRSVNRLFDLFGFFAKSILVVCLAVMFFLGLFEPVWADTIVVDHPGSRVVFQSPGSDEMISGVCEVILKSYHAAQIDLYLNEHDSQQVIFLGSARQLSNHEWIFIWDTGHTPAGDYYLYNIAYNSDNNILPSDSRFVRVRSDRIDAVDLEQTIEIQIISPTSEAELGGKINFEAVSEADRMLVYLRNEVSDVIYLLGEAQLIDHVWLLEFDTVNYPNGGYHIYAKLWAKGNYGFSRLLPFTISNASENETSSSAQKISYHLLDVNKPMLRKITTTETRKINPLDVSAIEIDKQLVVDQVEIERLLVKNQFQSDDSYLMGRFKIEGSGPPNSLVMIHVYGNPYLLTTLTDNFGNWVSEADHILELGEHEIYVTLLDSYREPLARSELYKISLERNIPSSASGAIDFSEGVRSNHFYLIIYMTVAIGAVALVIFSFLVINAIFGSHKIIDPNINEVNLD